MIKYAKKQDLIIRFKQIKAKKLKLLAQYKETESPGLLMALKGCDHSMKLLIAQYEGWYGKDYGNT